MIIKDFLGKLQYQAHGDPDEKILERIMLYPSFHSPQQEAIMKQFGFTSDVQYVAHICGKAGIPYAMAWEAVKKQYLSSYSSEEELQMEFDQVYYATPFDKEWRERTFKFILKPNAGPDFPEIKPSSVVNGLTKKQAEATLRALIGGREKNSNLQMNVGNKYYASGKRAEELAKFGFSEAYAEEYMNQFVDDNGFTADQVKATVSKAYESVRNQGKIASRSFNVRGYYK